MQAEAAAPDPVPGPMAAAILLLILDDDNASRVLSALDPDEMQQIGREMLAAAEVSEREIAGSLSAFAGHLSRVSGVAGGPSAAPRLRTLIEAAVGEDDAPQIIERIAPIAHRPPFASLQWHEPARIADMLSDEHPQAIATVLAHLEPRQAAQVIATFDDERRIDIVHRIATLGEIKPAILDELDARISAAARQAPRGRGSAGGAEEAARLLARGDASQARATIAALAKRDRRLARAIDEALLLFDDLGNLDAQSLGTLIRAIDADVLATALVGSAPAFVDRMLSALSSRAGDTVRDGLAERRNARAADVEEARRAILTAARRLADAGDIRLDGATA